MTIALLVKPFAALAFFLVAWLIAKALKRLIPEGRLKQVLYSPLPWLRKDSGGR